MKKNTSLSNAVLISAALALIATIIASLWLYVAHCFEKSIEQTHAWLVKSGHMTTEQIHINKYTLTARFTKPIIKTSIKGLALKYAAADCFQFSYHILTKTLTMQPLGDETISVDSSDNATAYPVITAVHADNKNTCKYSVRFDTFIPTLSLKDLDPAVMLSNVINAIKSVRLKCENYEIQIKDTGIFTAKSLKYTVEPTFKTGEQGAIALHVKTKHAIALPNYIPHKDAKSPFVSTPSLPKESLGHSHITLTLGDKSPATMHRLINEFVIDSNWSKLTDVLDVQAKSEGKQTFNGLKRDSSSDGVFTGSKNEIDLHIDFNDTYDATWRHEYLPFLQLVSTFMGNLEKPEGENSVDEKTVDEHLLALLPAFENNNPVKKHINLNVVFGGEHINTKIGFGYTIAQHGAQFNVEIPLKKDAVLELIEQFDALADYDIETFIDGSIAADLVLRNSNAILDDIAAILVRCQKTFNDPKLFSYLTANRALVDLALTTFGKKLDDNNVQIKISYDTKLKKLNYDTARNVGDVMAKLLPMFLKGGDEHDHDH
ncbi:MAG: hypothetical protein V4482_04050 [Pseudomonadota bacterium]